jgi:hypothetical protein
MAKCSPFNKNYMSKIGKDCNKSNKLNVFSKGRWKPLASALSISLSIKMMHSLLIIVIEKKRLFIKSQKLKEYKNIII